jgi:gluconolactonase
MCFPNGIQLSEDEKILYIGECATDRVVQAILTEDGNSAWWTSYYTRMSNPGGGGPDGMCWDVEGNLYVAIWDAGGVAVLDPRGNQIDFIQVPEGYGTTYAIFGGPDNKDLYILESNSNTIWKVKARYAGKPQYHETWIK